MDESRARYVTVAVVADSQEEAERVVYDQIYKADQPMRVVRNAIRLENLVTFADKAREGRQMAERDLALVSP